MSGSITPREVERIREAERMEELAALAKLRKAIARLMPVFAIILMIVIVLTVLVMFYIMLSGGETELIDRLALIGVLLVSLGMILGSTLVFFGMIMSWLGITAAFTIAMEGKGATASAKVGIQSANPGIVMILGGVILIGLSLYKPLHYEVSTETVTPLLLRPGTGPPAGTNPPARNSPVE